MAASRSESGPGTAIDSCASLAQASVPSAPPARYLAHLFDGYTGMNASGKSASRAPLAAISPASLSILSIVAARSKATDSAWTHATFTVSSIRQVYGASERMRASSAS